MDCVVIGLAPLKMISPYSTLVYNVMLSIERICSRGITNHRTSVLQEGTFQKFLHFIF